MNEQEALAAMIPPGAHKRGKWMQGVIQIWVTRACDKSCFNCTQGSNLGGNPGMITLENFEKAVINLKDYHGVVGVFGGNPAKHPNFPDLCEILRRHIPYARRGLWCNNPLGHGAVMRRTFNPQHSNLNVHLDQKAYDEFKRDWPECSPVGLRDDSRHSPVFGSPIDLNVPEADRWERISRCDINHHWSGMFGQFRGELRFFFCEIAGAQAMLNQFDDKYPDTGLEVFPNVWGLPMELYADQVRHHCHRCLVPYRGYGELAQAADGTERTTQEYADVFKPKRPGRSVEILTQLSDLSPDRLDKVVNYIQNSKK